MELSEIIEQIDIVEYISQYAELEERNGEYWCLSLFKDEDTPSFSIRRETNTFYDFSSGIGGNVFTFVKYYHRCSSTEAVEILKKYIGTDGETVKPREKLRSTLICKRFAKPKAAQKASKVSVLPADYMLRYEKRDDKLSVWESEGISKESLSRFQVMYDSYSDRLVYPIRNISGDIVNIGGRTLDPDWKSKGLRKYNYFFQWGTMDTIYGIAENMPYIKEKKEIILFEGCKSVLIADSWGIRNCGSLLTSHLNPHQLKILAKLGCRVVFALDKDVNIRADHNINKLKQYVNVEYICDMTDLLSAKDSPVDKGKEVFEQLYDKKFKFR